MPWLQHACAHPPVAMPRRHAQGTCSLQVPHHDPTPTHPARLGATLQGGAPHYRASEPLSLQAGCVVRASMSPASPLERSEKT
jgi:hypothetical protein